MKLKERGLIMKDFFNEKIDSYDDVHETFMETKRSLIDALEGKIEKVLDLGAGTGLELIHLFEKYPEAKVTVIDISDKMLERLNERDFADRIETICGDFFEVEFGSDFDAVISTSALHHFTTEEKVKLYTKIRECLKSNGLFVNCDKMADNQEAQDLKFYELEHNLENYKHLDTPLTRENEVKILSDIGFNDIIVEKVDKDNYALIKTRK